MSETKEAILNETVDIVDKTLTTIEDTLEAIEKMPTAALTQATKKQQYIILGLTAATTAAVTGTLVRLIVKKRMTLKYEELMQKEIAETKAFYQNLNKPPLDEMGAKHEELDVSPGVKMATEVIERYQGKTPYHKAEKAETPEVVVETAEVITNVFVEGKPMDVDFDYEVELANRTEDNPYVISRDEFNQGEKDYQRATLTWYVHDDTLTDEKDEPIPDSDSVVGDDNLLRFGYGSGDPHILYVRNDRMEMDFEVVQSMKSYANDVLGLTHSNRPDSRKTPRFRHRDG